MIIEFEVDRLFNEDLDRSNQCRTNPITGGRYVRGLDPIAPQKRRASRALEAREWFAMTGPEDAPLLPLSYWQRENLKCGDGFLYIVALFARSLAALDYDFDAHPSFEDYARGVTASPYARDCVKRDEGLSERYPPRQLDGLVGGFYWEPKGTRKAQRRHLLTP